MMAGEPTELVFILITSSASVALMLMLWWKWPKLGRLFHLKEYVQEPQVWIVVVYERVEKSVIWVCERAQRAEQMNFMTL